jgi:hypothetical protein
LKVLGRLEHVVAELMRNAVYWIFGVAILAAGAAGILIGAGVLDLSKSGRSAEGKLVARMIEAAKGGGYAVTFAHADAGKWQVAAGHRLEKFSVEGGDAAFARLSSSVALNRDTWEWSGQGLSTTFPVAFNNQTNGTKIEIAIVARAAAVNPSPALSVVYATQQAGNSGWQQIPLTAQLELKTFVFQVPEIAPGTYTAQPILVVHADETGEGRAAEILGVYIRQLGE